MTSVVLFDCEYLTADGAMRRLWCGPLDPDPQVVQIGAVRLSLEAPYAILETLRIFIKTRDRAGHTSVLDPYFTDLTGISVDDIEREGVSHHVALDRFADFCDTDRIWSWGKDEINLLAVSSYMAGVAPNIPASRFSHAARLFMKAGMSLEDVYNTTSAKLAEHFQIELPNQRHHDALDDALSIGLSLQKLLNSGGLVPSDFEV